MRSLDPRVTPVRQVVDGSFHAPTRTWTLALSCGHTAKRRRGDLGNKRRASAKDGCPTYLLCESCPPIPEELRDLRVSQCNALASVYLSETRGEKVVVLSGTTLRAARLLFRRNLLRQLELTERGAKVVLTQRGRQAAMLIAA